MKRFSLLSTLTLAGLLALGATACDKKDAAAPAGAGATPAAPATGTAPAAPAAPSGGAPSADALKIFSERCAICHGATGKGDGVGAAALNPKPRNYGDKAWQASVTDEQIRKTIVYGGAAVGKSPIMPSSPDLDGKTETVDGLVKIVRSFGK